MNVSNFVQCSLVTPVATNTTELVLNAPVAPYAYPPLEGGTLVIADSVARPSFYEVISYTHRIDNVLYGVVRAKEGTTARAWTGVTWIYQALTAADYIAALLLKANAANAQLTGIPTAPTAALGTNTDQIATMAAIQAAIAALLDSSPAALDTLNELAAALGDDPNFAATMNAALAGKEPTIVAGTAAQMWLGNKTWASVLSQVQGTLLTGLGAGANTPIVNTDTLIGALAKIQNQLNNKANFTDSRLSDAREWTATEVSQAEAEAGSVTVARKWSPLRVWQAVLGSKLTGINLTLGTEVSATDTVLIALGKLQKQITDAATNLAGSVRATVLTGYVSGSNVALASSDTVLAAFGKLQAQITALATSKLDATANAVSATKLATARTIGGVAFDGTANINLPGVDAAGNQSTSGNAATATKLQTARSIALAGDVTGSATFDGSSNVSITATVADDSHTHDTRYPVLSAERLLVAVPAGSWVTIAQVPSNGGRAYGEFIVYDNDDSRHNAVKIIASHSFGQSVVACVGGNRFGTRTIAHVRVLYGTVDRTYDGAKLQVYIENTCALRVRALMINQINGWSAWSEMTPVVEGTPAGWAEDATTRYDDITNTATGFSGSFSGSGAGLTSLNASNLSTGTLPIARGGTGGATAAAARTALGIGSMATRNVTISTAAPSGGVDGDIWFKV